MNMDSQNEAPGQNIAQQLSKCDYCDKTYLSVKNLNRHIKVHKEELRHQCSMCGKKFIEKYTLKRHFELFHMRITKNVCDHCGAKFGLKDNLKKHIKNIHLTEPDILAVLTKCTLCDSYFKTKIHLNHHMMKYHRENVKQNCSKNTKTMKDQGKDDQCCPDDLLAAALEKSDLDLIPEPDIRTIETVTINGKKYIKCDMCEYRSCKFSALERHMVIHKTTKLFKCPSCDMRYKYCSDLRVHIKHGHGITCKSNTNKALLNLINGLSSVVSTPKCKNKGKKKYVEEENITTKSQISETNGTHIAKNQVHIPKARLEAGENVNGLSMPILDDESMHTISEVTKTKEIFVAPKQLPNQPLLQNNCYYQNNNSTNQKNVNDASSNINKLNSYDTVSKLPNPQNHLATSPEKTANTNVLRDALLGQANVPLIDEVKANTLNVLQIQTEEQNEAEVEPYIFNYTNGGVVYELSGDLYSECELGDENILKIMGSVGGPINSESNQNSINERTKKHVLVNAGKDINTLPDNDFVSNSPIVEQELLSDLTINNDISNIIHQNEIIPSEPLNNADGEIEKYFHKYVPDRHIQFIRNSTAEIKEMDKKNSVPSSTTEKNADSRCKVIYPDENISKIRPELSLENMESNKKILCKTKVRKTYNNAIDGEPLPSHMENKRISELSTRSDHNVDIDINEYDFDVSFDINELSFETSNANISLTDIVKDMGSQSDIHQNISIDSEKDLLQNWNKPDKSNEVTEEPNDIADNSGTGAFTQHSNGTYLLDESLLNFAPQKYVSLNPKSTYIEPVHIPDTMMDVQLYYEQIVTDPMEPNIRNVLPICQNFISNVNATEDVDASVNSTTEVSKLKADIYLANIDVNDSIKISSEKYLTEKTTITQFPYIEDIDMNKDKTYAVENVNPIALSSDMSTDDLSLTNIDIQVTNFGFDVSSVEVVHKVHECGEDLSSGNIQCESLYVNDVNDAFTEQEDAINIHGAEKNKAGKGNNIQDVTDLIVTDIIPSPCMLGISSSNKESSKDIDENAVITSKLLERESSFCIPVHNDEHLIMNEPDLLLAVNPQLVSLYVENTETESPVLNDTAYECLKSINNNQDTTAESLIKNLEPDYTIEDPIPAHAEYNVRVKLLKKVMQIAQNYEHKCKKCLANFKRSADLKRHQLTHNPRNKLLCYLCGKSVSSKSALKIHLKSHNSDKILCWICGMQLAEVSFKFHKCVSTYQCKCPLCERTFINPASQKRHILSEHVYKRKGREKLSTEDLVDLIDELN